MPASKAGEGSAAVPWVVRSCQASRVPWRTRQLGARPGVGPSATERTAATHKIAGGWHASRLLRAAQRDSGPVFGGSRILSL